MITWKDFVLDDVIGAVLSPEIFESDDLLKVCREPRSNRTCDMDVADRVALIQETRHASEPKRNSNTGCVRPADGLESLEASQPTHRDVGVTSGQSGLRQRGAG